MLRFVARGTTSGGFPQLRVGCGTCLERTPTRSGRAGLSAVQGCRDESGRTRQKTVETFGFAGELEATYDGFGGALPGGSGREVTERRADERIRAHFLTCYLALLIFRLSQRALPTHPSAVELLGEICALNCSYAGDGRWLFDHRRDPADEVFALVGKDSPKKWMRTRDARALFEEGEEARLGLMGAVQKHSKRKRRLSC